jgi:hypothetical protein
MSPSRSRLVQAFILAIVAGVTAAMFFASSIGAIKEVVDSVSPMVTYVGTVLLVVGSVGANLFLQRRPQHWRREESDVLIRRLSANSWASIGGLLVLLWVPRLVAAAGPNPGRVGALFAFRIGASWTYNYGELVATGTERPPVASRTGSYTETVVSEDGLYAPNVAIVGFRRTGRVPIYAPCPNTNTDLRHLNGDADFWWVADDHLGFYVCDRNAARALAAGLDGGHVDDSKLTPDYRFPLRAGESWGYVGVRRHDNYYRWYVERRLDYQVPAGSFSGCYKLLFYTNPDQQIRWVCPHVGLVAIEYRHHGTVTEGRAELATYSASPINP